MVNIYVKDLIDKCNGRLFCGDKDKRIENCFVDSRVKTNGGTFFGIKGKKVNGSLYYKEAFDNGASVCVISNVNNIDANYNDKTIIIVDDVLDALKKIAEYKRSLFSGEVIGITGSVGKTSTKELIYSVLKKKYKVLKTQGNQNSQIGLPLTILRLTDEEVMVLEMGMSMKGEMHNLSVIAKPTISVITNVLTAHIGNLGSRENILREKLKILDGMDKKVLLINQDNDLLNGVHKSMDSDVDLYTYGVNNGDFRAFNIREGVKTLFDTVYINNIEVLGSKVFIHNALAAILIGKLLDVKGCDIKLGINESTNILHRLNLIKLKSIELIDDTYNASFDSVKAALEFMRLFKGRKVAVLADMLELGSNSKKLHKKLGEEIMNNDVDFLVTVGKDIKQTRKIARKLGMSKKNQKHFKNELKARTFVRELSNNYDVMLIKGSNDFKLDNLVEYLKRVD